MFVIKKDVEDIDLCTMACFLDASFANLKDIILYKNNKSFYPIAWKSRKIKRVVAETVALEQAQEACFMIKSFICVGMKRKVSEEFLHLKCYIDNKSLIDSIYSTKLLQKKSCK